MFTFWPEGQYDLGVAAGIGSLSTFAQSLYFLRSISKLLLVGMSMQTYPAVLKCVEAVLEGTKNKEQIVVPHKMSDSCVVCSLCMDFLK